MTRALPTPTGKGIFFFHKSETYELTCNYDSCWWVTHPHQRSIDRNNWPLTMYISEAFTNETCKKCGNITVVCKIVHKFASVWCKTALGEVGGSLP